jgi:hypothetical protein
MATKRNLVSSGTPKVNPNSINKPIKLGANASHARSMALKTALRIRERARVRRQKRKALALG